MDGCNHDYEFVKNYNNRIASEWECKNCGEVEERKGWKAWRENT